MGTSSRLVTPRSTSPSGRPNGVRGDPDTEEQLDRVSGDGWVAAKDGDYADALAKGHTVILLVTESTGAFSADLDRVLRQLARTARASGSIDHTPYGTSRASTPFPEPALNAPGSEARAARGATTDSTSDPRA